MKQIYLTLSLLLTTFTINTFAQNALHFDGTDDVVQTTFPGVLGDSNRTFEAWIKVDTSAPT